MAPSSRDPTESPIRDSMSVPRPLDVGHALVRGPGPSPRGHGGIWPADRRRRGRSRQERDLSRSNPSKSRATKSVRERRPREDAQSTRMRGRIAQRRPHRAGRPGRQLGAIVEACPVTDRDAHGVLQLPIRSGVGLAAAGGRRGGLRREAATRAKPAKAGDAKLRGYRAPVGAAKPVELPNGHFNTGALRCLRGLHPRHRPASAG